MASDYTRLIVIGMLITAFSGTMVAQEIQRIGDFVYQHDLDDFDDTDRSAILTVGDTEGSGLFWACSARGLTVILISGTFYGGDVNDNIRVRYRFDRNTASGYEDWEQSSNNQGAILPTRMVPDFTVQAVSADSVLVQAVDPVDDERNQFRFGLDGLAEALNLLPCANNR